MREPIESKVAMTILEEHIGEITLDSKTYSIPAITTATIVAVSRLISTLPEFDPLVSDAQVVADVLSKGHHGETLARIAATLMLGQKRIMERKDVVVATGTTRHWSWRSLKWEQQSTRKRISEIDYLTQKILMNCTTGQLREITFSLIEQGGLDDFFIITTFLRKRNRLIPTKKVEETTASGHS